MPRKNFKRKALKKICNTVKNLAIAGGGVPTFWGFYEIKKPECLEKLLMEKG